jgi:hypothetical protein
MAQKQNKPNLPQQLTLLFTYTFQCLFLLIETFLIRAQNSTTESIKLTSCRQFRQALLEQTCILMADISFL